MSEKSPERLAREARAVELELKVPGNIGDDKLAKRIAEREAVLDGAANTPIGAAAPSENGTANPVKGDADKKPKRKRKDDAAKGGIVTVTGPKQGRRRAGHRFGLEPVTIPAGDLSDADLASLHSDPTLAVSIT